MKTSKNILWVVFIAFFFGSVAFAQSQNLLPEVSEFYRLADKVAASDDLTSVNENYVSHLPPDRQLVLARALANEPSDRFRAYGVALLTNLKSDDEAVAPLAALVLEGKDVMGLFWGWMHGADPCLSDRMTLKLSGDLLSRLDHLNADQRKRAEDLLSEVGTSAPKGFSRAETEKHLTDLQAEFDRRHCK